MSVSGVWSAEEVQALLCIVGDEAVQRELDGAVRNEKVFQVVSSKMNENGFNRSASKCCIKLKKLRSDYQRVKDRNGWSGVERKHWRWFDMMDAIYSHRPASMGREAGMDSTMDLLESIIAYTDSNRRRDEDFADLLRSQQESDERQMLALQQRHDAHLEAVMQDLREARQQEGEFMRQRMEQTAAFSQAFLATLGQMIQTMGRRQGP